MHLFGRLTQDTLRVGVGLCVDNKYVWNWSKSNAGNTHQQPNERIMRYCWYSAPIFANYEHERHHQFAWKFAWIPHSPNISVFLPSVPIFVLLLSNMPSYGLKTSSRASRWVGWGTRDRERTNEIFISNFKKVHCDGTENIENWFLITWQHSFAAFVSVWTLNELYRKTGRGNRMMNGLQVLFSFYLWPVTQPIITGRGC